MPPKKTIAQPPRRGRPPLQGAAKITEVRLRTREEWRTWLKEFAEFQRTDMSDLIDEALEVYAAKLNFTRPPKR